MPFFQVDQVLAKNFGPDWRSHFEQFDETPIAAASIGQVHKYVKNQSIISKRRTLVKKYSDLYSFFNRAVFKDGRVAAVKIQYPGVRDSIVSDIDNLSRYLSKKNWSLFVIF